MTRMFIIKTDLIRDYPLNQRYLRSIIFNLTLDSHYLLSFRTISIVIALERITILFSLLE